MRERIDLRAFVGAMRDAVARNPALWRWPRIADMIDRSYQAIHAPASPILRKGSELY